MEGVIFVIYVSDRSPLPSPRVSRDVDVDVDVALALALARLLARGACSPLLAFDTTRR